jgi:hypothetical protein
VINGFSDLLVDVFGDAIGKHARSAVGMAALPGNAPVEVEAILEVEWLSSTQCPGPNRRNATRQRMATSRHARPPSRRSL